MLKKTVAALCAAIILAGGCAGVDKSRQAETRPAFGVAENQFLAADRDLDLYCLRVSYPGIGGLIRDNWGREWLILANGAQIPYNVSVAPSGLAVDLKQAMAEPYILEPERPDTPECVAPGRRRSYEFMEAIYGGNKEDVRKNLQPVPFLGRNISLSPAAARAIGRVAAELAPKHASLRPWLLPEGGFYWRRIAGEQDLSAHAYGIALDIGVKKAPYWRWSRVTPHPLQKTYPPAIVAAFEKHGFIWGGKWHEYDLMHYEYRPEIICKARIRKAREKAIRKQQPVQD